MHVFVTISHVNETEKKYVYALYINYVHTLYGYNILKIDETLIVAKIGEFFV